MELTLLTIPGCPHAALFEERLAVALAGHPGVTLVRREIAGDRATIEVAPGGCRRVRGKD